MTFTVRTDAGDRDRALEAILERCFCGQTTKTEILPDLILQSKNASVI